MMEDSNQDIEYAKDQGGQSELETEMRISNSINIRHQITRNTITAGFFNRGFPFHWNLITGGNKDVRLVLIISSATEDKITNKCKIIFFLR